MCSQTECWSVATAEAMQDWNRYDSEAGNGRDRYRRKSKCIRCNSSGDSFQNATRWLLLSSQFFGIMPLIDIGVGRKSQLRRPSFRWCCPNTLYSVLLVAMATIETCCCVYQIFTDGILLGNFGALTFYLLAMVSRSLCLYLAARWSRILLKWRNTERIFLELPYTSPAAHRKHYSLTIVSNVTFGVFIFLSLRKLIVVAAN